MPDGLNASDGIYGNPFPGRRGMRIHQISVVALRNYPLCAILCISKEVGSRYFRDQFGGRRLYRTTWLDAELLR